MNTKPIWKYTLVILISTILDGLLAFGEIATLDQLLDIETINNDTEAQFPLEKLSDELATDVESHIPVMQQIIRSERTSPHRIRVIVLVLGNALLKESNPINNRRGLNVLAEIYTKHPQFNKIVFEFLHRAKNGYLPDWFKDELHYRISQGEFQHYDIMLLALFRNEQSTSKIQQSLDKCTVDKKIFVQAALARQTNDHQYLEQITNRFYALTQENWIYDPFGNGKSEELREMIIALSYIGTAESLYVLFDGLILSRIIFPEHHLLYRRPWDLGVQRIRWLMDSLGESSISSELTRRKPREAYKERVKLWWHENKESIKKILDTNEPLPYYWVRDARVIWFVDHMEE